MSDEFAKEVLGEEAVKAAKDSGKKSLKWRDFLDKMDKKKLGIIAGAVGIVALIILCIICFWPKKKAVAGSFLEGLDVLCTPNSVIKTASGDFLVTDVYGKKIWTVTGNHAVVYAGADTVEDLYGEPMGGYNDAALPQSLFKEPWAITPFLGGYAVSDTENHAVRLVTDASVQTVNGRSSDLEEGDLGVTFDLPTGLATDDAGNLYVADTGRGAIYRISKEGIVDTYVDGLNAPMGICYANGLLYVAETGEHRVISVKDGKVSVVAGTGEEGDADGPAATATFSSPKGVAVTKDGVVFIADTVNGTVRRVKNGTVDTILIAEDKALTTSPVSPTSLMTDDEWLYVCDPFARMIYKLDNK